MKLNPTVEPGHRDYHTAGGGWCSVTTGGGSTVRLSAAPSVDASGISVELEMDAALKLRNVLSDALSARAWSVQGAVVEGANGYNIVFGRTGDVVQVMLVYVDNEDDVAENGGKPIEPVTFVAEPEVMRDMMQRIYWWSVTPRRRL